jgi:hypothetical protein
MSEFNNVTIIKKQIFTLMERLPVAQLFFRMVPERPSE